MLDVPDILKVLSDPLKIETGARAGLRLFLNAKNGFLPKYAQALSIVLGPDIKDHVKVVSTGRLLGGRVRITLEASDTAPLLTSTVQVALVDPSLPEFLTASGVIEIMKKEAHEDEKSETRGGEPDVDIQWHGRAKWEEFGWDQDTVGVCHITRDDADANTIVRMEWLLNEAFGPYERTLVGKNLGETATKSFQDAYVYPVCWGMFQQALAEYRKEHEADAEGRTVEIPDDYVKGEIARLARSVLIALEPELAAVAVAVAET